MKPSTAVPAIIITVAISSFAFAMPDMKPTAAAAKAESAPAAAPLTGNKKSEGIVIEGLKVEKAQGQNAYDLTEIFAKRAELHGKIISVRGQVVKISTGIMRRNWVHIKDGTGVNAENKLVVTSKDKPSIGDIVTCTGVFHNNVDFGGGYKYETLMEDAVIK